MVVKAQKVQIKSSASDVFYRGVKNPVSIVASGYEGVEPSVSSGAKIYPGNVSGYEGQYVVEITDKDVKSVRISFGKASAKFKVLNIPYPTITVGGYKSGDDIPKSVFSSKLKLDATVGDGDFPFKEDECMVASFVYMKEADGITSSMVVTGNEIPAEILEDIKNKPSGSPVFFIGIKVSTPLGSKSAPGFKASLK